MKKWMLLVLAASLLFLGACGKTAAPEAEPGTPNSAYNPDKKVLEVSLEGNPTTGYAWTWSQEGEGAVRLESEEYIPEDTSGLWDGVGGVCLFRFAPEAEGEGRLLFSYARPWEDKTPLETYETVFRVFEKDGALFIELA